MLTERARSGQIWPFIVYFDVDKNVGLLMNSNRARSGQIWSLRIFGANMPLQRMNDLSAM